MTSAPDPAEQDVPRELDAWRRLWEEDRGLPLRSHRRFVGPLIVALKRLLRPFFRFPLNDLFERQRAFNLALTDKLEDLRRDVQGLDRARAELHRDLLQVRDDLVGDVKQHARRLAHLEAFKREGLDDVMRHTDALFARVDQKFDRYRRESRAAAARLGALLAAAERGGSALARAGAELDYLALEERFRGAEGEIGHRLEVYLPRLRGEGRVLDLGCGRGEALRLLRERGVDAWGVDSSAEMVRRCREAGLPAEEGDLFEVLAAQAEASHRAIVSFHVVEHLPAEALRRLVRLAWRALAPGGVLILETPSPLSLVVAARNFWLDPSHRRPVHPETLRLLFEEAGFEQVERLDLRPFPDDERLPELDVAALPVDQQPLAHRLNLLRDRLDDLLFGFQDYGLLGVKASG